jgi:type VI protein secretion system component VasK
MQAGCTDDQAAWERLLDLVKRRQRNTPIDTIVKLGQVD